MLSFIIPVLNEGERLPALLQDLRERFPGAELLVVDGGSSDDSVPMALAQADVVLVGAPGRALQMNLGARSASGEWLCFLHADSTPEFDEDSLKAFLAQDVQWTFFRVLLAGRSRGLPMVAASMNLRSRLTSVATGDQLLTIRRGLFEELGGFADLPLMEDVEFCKRLRRRMPPTPTSLRVRSSGRRWDEQGLVRTILRMWALRLAYWLGVPPVRLWDHYYGRRALSGSGE